MTIDVPTTPTSLMELLQPDNPLCDSVFLQAPVANTAEVFFGPNPAEHFLLAGSTSNYPARSLSAMFVKANIAGQKLIVSVESY